MNTLSYPSSSCLGIRREVRVWARGYIRFPSRSLGTRKTRSLNKTLEVLPAVTTP